MIFDGAFVTQRSIRVDEYGVVQVGSTISCFKPNISNISFNLVALTDVTPGIRFTLCHLVKSNHDLSYLLFQLCSQNNQSGTSANLGAYTKC